jgi:hypothetical protein
MTRVAYAAPLAILAILFAGCTSRGPDTPSSASIRPMEHPYSAGTGVVQAVMPAPGPIAAGPNTSARNPAVSSPESGLQRLRIRMDDGRVVYVDTPGGDFAPGTRVQLSDANEIRRR